MRSPPYAERTSAFGSTSLSFNMPSVAIPPSLFEGWMLPHSHAGGQ
ncbi:hypothetical protein [Vibrio navarrensis]|nr:hypothetical protein [Vibrio navarrensis]